jgi:predicted kinase
VSNLNPIIEAYMEMLNGGSSNPEFLEEKLITFGGTAYPKFGHVVIMAGGAGSGKGFVLNNLVGLEGKVFDVDELKQLATRSPRIIQRVRDEMGIDLTKLDTRKNELALKDPDNVSLLHEIIGDALNLPDRRQQAFLASVMATPSERKPNMIFDVTLKDLMKLNNITRMARNLGYDKKNIHIVWVINDIEVAKNQNETRDRTVPVDILVNTHRGVSATMLDVVQMGDGLTKYMDGDIVFAFNQVKVDSEFVQRDSKVQSGVLSRQTRGQYVKDANYFYVKRAGRGVTSLKDLSKDIRQKVASYVPPNVSWVD